MSENALPAYRHSGKFTLWGPLLPIAAAVAIGFPLGHLYALLIRWIPFVYINIFVTIGYGATFGWLTGRLLKTGRVRNAPLAAACGAIAGLIALYFEWNGHVHVLFEDGPWFFYPDEIGRALDILYAEGSWTFHGSTITGLALAAVWVIEAALIVGFAAYLPWQLIAITPYSEQYSCWLDEEKSINTLAAITDAAHLAALRSGDIMSIVQAQPRPEGASDFTRLILKRSSKCTTFCTLRVQNVTQTIDTNGKVTDKTTDLTADLILDATMFDVIAQLEHLKPVPAPTG